MSEQNTPTEYNAGDSVSSLRDTRTPVSFPPGTVASSPGTGGSGTCGFAIPANTSIPCEDLSTDMLIRGTARTPFKGTEAPVLGGVALLARLGQGGMGKVYFGFHLRLEREVAVKVVWSDMAERHPELVPRFKREARLASKVVSPHLVTVLDVDEKDGLHYMVMEYVHGVSAAGYLKQLRAAERKGLSEVEALATCLAASRGLAAAHQKGIIHRDVKPDNILIPRGETSGELQFEGSKLADLGIARQEASLDSHLTMPRQFMGTPGFAAPEQCGGADTCGKPADIFGMGATLYALLAGREPFLPAKSGSYEDELSQVVNAVKKTPHASIRSLRSDITPATALIIDRCLEKKPENRYADAKELVPAMERALNKLFGDAQGREARERITEHVPAGTEFEAAPKPEDFEERTPIRVKVDSSRTQDAEKDTEAWRSKTRGAKKSGGWMLPVAGVLMFAMAGVAFATYAGRGYIASLFGDRKSSGPSAPKPDAKSDADAKANTDAKAPALPENKSDDTPLKAPVPPGKKVDEQPVEPPAPPDKKTDDPATKAPAPPEKKPDDVKKPDDPPLKLPDSSKTPEKKPDEPVKPLVPDKKVDDPTVKPQDKKPDELPAKTPEPKVEVPVKNAPLITLDLGKDVKLELVRIQPGTFKMGSPEGEEARDDNEIQHDVTITKPFYMGKFTVTQAQYEAVMGENPSEFKDANLPVEHVSWFDAANFCAKAKQLTQKDVRLPTEAEWEYACRAGTTTAFNTGATITPEQANYNGESGFAGGATGENRRRPTAVGSFKPNAFGLFDMHGNVWQWCADFHNDNYYRNSEANDPPGPASGTARVSRGGAWDLPPRNARSASRNNNNPNFKSGDLGFRIVVNEE